MFQFCLTYLVYVKGTCVHTLALMVYAPVNIFQIASVWAGLSFSLHEMRTIVSQKIWPISVRTTVQRDLYVRSSFTIPQGRPLGRITSLNEETNWEIPNAPSC